MVGSAGFVAAETGYGVGTLDIPWLPETGAAGGFLRRSSQATNTIIAMRTTPPADAPAIIGTLFLLETESVAVGAIKEVVAGGEEDEDVNVVTH